MQEFHEPSTSVQTYKERFENEVGAKGILELLHNPDMIYEMGQNGLDLLKKELNSDRPAKVLYDTCMKLMK